MENIVSNIEDLCLDSLDQAWVEAVYYAEYLEFGEFPDVYNSAVRNVRLRRVFRNIMDAVNACLAEANSDEEISWTSLSQRVPYRKLLAVLGYHIYTGTRHVMNEKRRTLSLLSARVYFKLLSIPGFMAYDIYHSQLFANSLACIGYPKIICDKFDEQKNKSKDDTDHEYKIANIRELKEQVNSLIKQLKLFVVDLRSIIEQLQLGPNDMNFEDILSNLVDVTGGAILSKLNVDRIELSQVNGVIYEVIDILMKDANQQPDADALRLLLKCLHNRLIAVSLDNKASNNLVQASYVAYCGVVLSKYGKIALDNFDIFLQHLCYNHDGLERAEARLSRIKMVSGLMTMLPPQIHSKQVKWIVKMSKSSKVNHRHLAVELLEKMLTHNNREADEIDNDSETNSQIGDSGIGADASEVQESGEGQNLEQGQDLNTTNASDNGQAAEPVANPQPEVSEEELQRILQEHMITVSYGEILRAIYNRVADTSGTVRQRAVAIFSRCLENPSPAMQQALKEMHGDGDKSRLMAVAARCVCDERAIVRRSGVSLVHRLLETQDAEPAAMDMGVLVSLCRDASILVRSAAIAALADLVVKRPTAVVIDSFLTGPFHQLSDPENKVQDTIKSLVQDLIINRIRKFTTAEEDRIPWMMLAGIITNNLRRHLHKACAQIASTASCLNVWLVDCLSTHLGALNETRDLQALVLLTCVSRYIDYSDVNFLLEYLFRLTDLKKAEQHVDPRLLPLTIELLCVWSRYALANGNSGLREHLVRRIASSADIGSRIESAFLALQLDTLSHTWTSELMHLAQQSALNGGGIDDWMRVADLSLVTPERPSDEMMQMVLNAIKNPPKEWTPDQYGKCVAGAGRMTVRCRQNAIALAPVVAALLHSDVPLQARVNALLVLADICTRYSNIMEPLLGDICSCLEASAPHELRRHAARSLTRLMLAGFLRLRTPLYYKYCALLADEDHDVREPAEYFVTCCLTTDAIYHHFVDCVRYYNSDTSENISFDSRQLIYDVMLQRLSPVQRLNIQCRLARDILENAADLVDEGEELQSSMNNALLDTITVLCGPRMRLPVPKKQAAATSDVTEIDDIQERVTTNIVSHKMKHTVAEVLVPAALRLHARLRAGGGQLLAYLVRLVTDLLNDYRQEIEDIIETDSELVEQIQQFQQTIGLEPTNGNARNLVTSSAPPEPETPRAPRRRAGREREPPRKRALRI